MVRSVWCTEITNNPPRKAYCTVVLDAIADRIRAEVGSRRTADSTGNCEQRPELFDSDRSSQMRVLDLRTPAYAKLVCSASGMRRKLGRQHDA
jgi:hypothetical protein